MRTRCWCSSKGSFNRIEYAREQLIQEQTDYNKWLLTQIPDEPVLSSSIQTFGIKRQSCSASTGSALCAAPRHHISDDVM